jgi:hypothetical protein
VSERLFSILGVPFGPKATFCENVDFSLCFTMFGEDRGHFRERVWRV